MSQKIPETWASCEIGEIADVIGGATPPSKDITNFDESSGIPWITPADLSGYKAMYISRGARNLSEKGFAACSAAMLPSGAVLFSSRAPVGYVAIAANPVCTNQGFKSFALADGIDSRFVYFYLRFIKPLAEERATGTTFKELSGAAAARLPLMVAPIKEQKRIADKLDVVLARVDACRERLDRVPGILKRFRQAVLAAATSGKLTGEWEDDGRTVTSTIGSVCRLVNGYAYSSKDYQSSGIPLVRISDIDGRHASPSDNIFVPQSLFDEKFLIRKGDILVAMSGATTGKVGIYQSDVPSLQNQRVGNLKITASERITTGYRNIVLMASSEIILGKAYGGAQPNISGKDIEAFEILLPPIDQQDEIVGRVEALFAYADRLEVRYTAARAHVERLTPALLAKAFRGELVPQDPSDEPASVLLERIRAVRAEHPTAKRRGKAPTRRVPRAPREKAAMTKSRHDNDVLHKPYLAGLLREAGGTTSVEDLFRRAELPVTDFYKQLAWEVENGHIRDDETRLEAA